MTRRAQSTSHFTPSLLANTLVAQALMAAGLGDGDFRPEFHRLEYTLDLLGGGDAIGAKERSASSVEQRLLFDATFDNIR